MVFEQDNRILIRQKHRRFNPRMQLIVKIKLKRLLQERLIKLLKTMDWLSHIVLVKKKKEKRNKLKVYENY